MVQKVRVRFLAVATALLMFSCGGETELGTHPATGGQAAMAVLEEGDPDHIEGESFPGDQLVREAWTGDLDGMIQRRYIRALVVLSKTFYFYEKGRPYGITYESLKEFERDLNQKLGLGPEEQVHVLFIPVARDRLLPDLVEGFGDIAAANLTITTERSKLVDFSVPAGTGVKEIVVTGSRSPEIRDVGDISGQEVYVRRSSSYYESLERLNSKLRSEGKPSVRIREADESLEDEDILEMVNAGLVGMTIVDSHTAALWAETFDQIRPLPDVAISEDNAIGWAFRKNSPQLAKAVNDFGQTHKIGTAFGNILLRRYYGNAKRLRNAASEQEMAKMRLLTKLFQKYAGQYDFDWLMVTAQAYQESGLDQNVKSAAGAVGIMQVMPSTAEAEPISVDNVEEIEANIHAGVKILRYYADHYFSEPELDEMNRMLFSFAAYNAGPNRINRLRRRAAEQGLDPNIWFRNVELVAAKSIGRETVQYVSNIVKYYIAYKLAAEAGTQEPTGA